MAKKKIKLTRPELKKQRDTMTRFQRFLPMLKLKQQQLQLTMRQITKQREQALKDIAKAQDKFDRYVAVFGDISGVNVPEMAKCKEIKVSETNIAGVNIPVYEGIEFEDAKYSLFSTPAWVDAALVDLREVNACKARVEIFERQYQLLQKELNKIVQRVNLFEKVMIPEAKENIRKIRIKLSDEMAAAVGRAKIAKGKLTESESHGGVDEEKVAEVG